MCSSLQLKRMRHQTWGASMTDRSQADQQAREWAANWAADGHGYWAVEELHVAGVVMGFGGIRAANWCDRQVYNLGYRSAPPI